MSWSVEFIPFVPWPVLWALATLGVALMALLFWRHPRGAFLRLATYTLLLLALANPHLKREDREPLDDIVAVVVDDSQSQAIAGRTGRTEALRQRLEERLKSLPNLEMRFVHSTATAEDERDGTMLFTDLGQALADVPPEFQAAVQAAANDGFLAGLNEIILLAALLAFAAAVAAFWLVREDQIEREPITEPTRPVAPEPPPALEQAPEPAQS